MHPSISGRNSLFWDKRTLSTTGARRAWCTSERKCSRRALVRCVILAEYSGAVERAGRLGPVAGSAGAGLRVRRPSGWGRTPGDERSAGARVGEVWALGKKRAARGGARGWRVRGRGSSERLGVVQGRARGRERGAGSLISFRRRPLKFLSARRRSSSCLRSRAGSGLFAPRRALGRSVSGQGALIRSE